MTLRPLRQIHVTRRGLNVAHELLVTSKMSPVDPSVDHCLQLDPALWPIMHLFLHHTSLSIEGAPRLEACER